jgi:hypothetical protein
VSPLLVKFDTVICGRQKQKEVLRKRRDGGETDLTTAINAFGADLVIDASIEIDLRVHRVDRTGADAALG